MSEVEKWEHSIDVWEREKWKMLRKYLTPEQLEAVSNVNGIVRKMRYGLKEELDEQHTQAIIDVREQSWEDGYHSARRYYVLTKKEQNESERCGLFQTAGLYQTYLNLHPTDGKVKEQSDSQLLYGLKKKQMTYTS